MLKYLTTTAHYFEFIALKQINHNGNRCKVVQQALEIQDEITYSLASSECLYSVLCILKKDCIPLSFAETANTLEGPQTYQ